MSCGTVYHHVGASNTRCSLPCDVPPRVTVGPGAAARVSRQEVVYHFIAFLLLCAASITMLVMLTDRSSSSYRYRDRNYEPKLAASVRTRPAPPARPPARPAGLDGHDGGKGLWFVRVAWLGRGVVCMC